MSVWAVVLAAGHGSRFGSLKQYELLCGKRIIDWSLAAARATCDHVVVVVGEARQNDDEPLSDIVVVGGPTRSGSVRAGLAAVSNTAKIIVVHDAARPFASPELFHAVIDAVRAGADCAIPGIGVVDTIKRVDPTTNEVLETPDRASLMAVQTPQAFRAQVLRDAHVNEGEATDDATLVELSGAKVVVVPGEVENRKVTDRYDLEFLSRTKR